MNVSTGCPKNIIPCLRGCNSCKNGTTIKSKVSFKYPQAILFLMGTEISALEPFGPEKMRFKDGNPFKIITKAIFFWSEFCWL